LRHAATLFSGLTGRPAGGIRFNHLNCGAGPIARRRQKTTVKKNVNNVSNLGHRAEFSTHGARITSSRHETASTTHTGGKRNTKINFNQEVEHHG
jgi:hypothetical protein